MLKKLKQHVKDIADVQKANQEKRKWKLKYKSQQEELLEAYRDEIKLLKKDNATRVRLSAIEKKVNLILEGVGKHERKRNSKKESNKIIKR